MTSKQRLQRINRLVSLKEHRRDEQRGRLAKAQRDTEDARSAREQAENSWQECADDAASADAPVSIAEFAESRAHLDSLKREVEVAEVKHRKAERRESARRDDACSAQRELRKMELWGENEAEKIRAANARQEQNETNELAARISKRSGS